MIRIILAIALTIVPCDNLKSQDSVLSTSMLSLVNAERSFAETCAQKGVRESFLEFLADSSILFRPHPVNGRNFMLQKPAPNFPPSVLLAWTPIYAEISGAGDLGYTTGPYELSDLSPKKEAAKYGAYFSIWKKQSDGLWKVVLDAGIQTSMPTAPLNSPFVPHSGMNKKRVNDSARELEEMKRSLIDTERSFASKCESGGAKGYKEYLCECTRMHRNNVLPMIGKDSIAAFLKKSNAKVIFEPIGSDVARSGDLGFVYGTYQSTSTQGKEKAEKGYFVRVWRRNPKDKWVIAFDSEQPVPNQKK